MAMKKNPHLGSSFTSWLDEKGIREKATAAAVKSAIAMQIGKAMKRQTDQWRVLAGDIQDAGQGIFATSQVQVTEKGYADEKLLGLTLLARTISNLRGALLLLDNGRIVEARIITRCCLENSFWVARLVEGGEAFAREMLHDTIGHKKKAGENILASGVTLDERIETQLRDWLRTHTKQVQNPKLLNPKTVAGKTMIGRTHIFYEQLSGDSCHPSLDALNRYVVPHTAQEVGGVDLDPAMSDRELAETLEYLCMAALGVCVGVNQLVGGTPGGTALNELADRSAKLSNETARAGK